MGTLDKEASVLKCPEVCLKLRIWRRIKTSDLIIYVTLTNNLGRGVIFSLLESKKARKKKNVLDVDTPSLSFKLTRSGINPSHKHSLWPRALFPCYDSVREGFQPIQVWSDLSHFPRLVQAIDSTQRRRPLLILAPPPTCQPRS